MRRTLRTDAGPRRRPPGFFDSVDEGDDAVFYAPPRFVTHIDDDAIGAVGALYDRTPRPVNAGQTWAVPTMTVVVEGVDLPGRRCGPNPEGEWYENVHVGVCVRGARQDGLAVEGRPWKVAELVPGDAVSAHWEVEVVVKGDGVGLDFGGPFVRGGKGDRHIGLAWGELSDAGVFTLFRGAKLRLDAVDPGMVADASRPGRVLVGRVGLTDVKGHPRCASIRPPDITWTARR